ncbi:MAG: DNA polymerase III subunit delta [candidate division KSB1 bacterium]|nr:DNA polymerase III subunit delta [candidate division KSB1 bacterium]MDZ7367917.1 DNA polymerase III subunit delta [candidate division KSB1 bacterium]MDZ7406516.1 DNA polymerase III subunit delta [candidate division KSB1 bacterium]
MKYDEFLNEVQNGRWRPVYFFAGEETGFIDEGSELLCQKLVTPGMRDFNFDVFYGGEVNARRVIDRATSFPMMASHRVIVLRDVQKMPPGDLEALAKYAANPSPTTYLIISMREKESRKKGIEALRKASAHIECKPLYENQIVPWIQKYVRRLNISISAPAAQWLASEVGASTSVLRSEIEKIRLYLGERTEITEADVQQVAGFRKEHSIFSLQDAVGAKNLAAALRIYESLSPNTSAGVIINSLARYFGHLHLAHGLPHKTGRDQAQLAEKAGVHAFFAERLQRAAQNYAPAEVCNALEVLLQTDYLLKTRGLGENLLMRLMLIAIVRCFSPQYLPSWEGRKMNGGASANI